jgi:tetratricopeptide (TPR) repeat protein
MKIVLILLVLGIFLISSGCTSPQENASFQARAFAENARASLKDADRMVDEDPQNATAWCIRGMSYNNNFGQYDVAIESYNRGLALDPANAICWLGKSITLRNMRQYDEADACFETACRLDPSFRDYRVNGRDTNVNYLITFRMKPSVP